MKNLLASIILCTLVFSCRHKPADVIPTPVPPVVTTPPSGIITTIAGKDTKSLLEQIISGGPATDCPISANGLAFDDSGNLYISAFISGIYKVKPSGIIYRVAGYTHAGGYSGDGGPATAARLGTIEKIAIDKNGNIYIADWENDIIRKIDANGIINTIAGNGMAGFTGDGFDATTVRLNAPYGVAVDDVGNLYIADGYNNRIRKVNTSGIISTIAGNGISGYSGDGGPATAAKLMKPVSVALDKIGNIYITDTSNAVRKINTAGIISTIAGTGVGGFSGDGGPATAAQIHICNGGVKPDNKGNIFISEDFNMRIRKVDAMGIITTVAGKGYRFYSPYSGVLMGGFSGDGGQATDAEISYPYSVAFDSSGNMYIADQNNGRVRKVNK